MVPKILKQSFLRVGFDGSLRYFTLFFWDNLKNLKSKVQISLLVLWKYEAALFHQNTECWIDPASSHTHPRLQEIVDQEHDKSRFLKPIFSPTLLPTLPTISLMLEPILSSTRAFGLVNLVILLVLQDPFWFWLDKAQVHLHSIRRETQFWLPRFEPQNLDLYWS